MKDSIGYCPLTKMEESCYITPINEKYNSYHSLINGFESSDLWIEGEFDFDAMEESLPELYKDIKMKDDDGRVWYPSIINDKEKGVAFITGKNKEDWQWAGIKNIPVPENEKERFKDPKTGDYLTHKSDPTSLKNFGKEGYISAIEYIGLLE